MGACGLCFFIFIPFLLLPRVFSCFFITTVTLYVHVTWMKGRGGGFCSFFLSGWLYLFWRGVGGMVGWSWAVISCDCCWSSFGASICLLAVWAGCFPQELCCQIPICWQSFGNIHIFLFTLLNCYEVYIRIFLFFLSSLSRGEGE